MNWTIFWEKALIERRAEFLHLLSDMAQKSEPKNLEENAEYLRQMYADVGRDDSFFDNLHEAIEVRNQYIAALHSDDKSEEPAVEPPLYH